MSDFEVKKTGETIMLGRGDYGWGVEAELVTVDGDEFAIFRGQFYVPCGYCFDLWSGSKMAYAHRHGGVCYQCGGKGWSRRWESEAKVVSLVKRRRSDAARKAKKRAEAEAVRQAEHAEWVAANPALFAELSAVYAEIPSSEEVDRTEDGWQRYQDVTEQWGDFVLLMAQRAQHGALTEAQAESVVEAIAEAKARHQAKADKVAASRHAGEVDAKVTVTGTVSVATTIQTNYGNARLVVVTGTGDDAGVTVKAFGSGQSLWEVAKGDVVEVTGTVKKHGEYDGLPQTEVTRAKFTLRNPE